MTDLRLMATAALIPTSSLSSDVHAFGIAVVCRHGERNQAEDGCFFLIDDLVSDTQPWETLLGQLGAWLNRGRRSVHPDTTRVRPP